MQTLSDKKSTINDHKITVPSKLIEYFRRKSNKNLCQDLKLLVEDTIEQKIRKVVCYDQKTVNGGFCDTCSFFYSVVDIYFKSSDGDLCVLTIEAEMGDLLRRIEELSKDTVL